MTLASVYLYISVSSNFSLMVLIGLYHNLVADNKVKNSVPCFLHWFGQVMCKFTF